MDFFRDCLDEHAAEDKNDEGHVHRPELAAHEMLSMKALNDRPSQDEAWIAD